MPYQQTLGAVQPPARLGKTETFVLLAYQRLTLFAALADGRIVVEGDRELADQFTE